MARIEGIKIENYRVLRHVTLGRMWYLPSSIELTPGDRSNRKKRSR